MRLRAWGPMDKPPENRHYWRRTFSANETEVVFLDAYKRLHNIGGREWTWVDGVIYGPIPKPRIA